MMDRTDFSNIAIGRIERIRFDSWEIYESLGQTTLARTTVNTHATDSVFSEQVYCELR